MQYKNRLMIILLLIIASLQLTGCGNQTAVAANPKPAIVEKIEGTEFNRVTLTDKAFQRLAIQTAPVAEQQIGGAARLVIPHSAIIYGLEGETWIYINPAPLVYTRQLVEIESIDNDIAVLFKGPDKGTSIVTVGVAELYGTDTGIGK